MEKNITLYKGTMHIKHNASMSGSELHEPIIQVPVHFFTFHGEENKQYMQFSFHFPGLEQLDTILFQLDQCTYSEDERAFLFDVIQLQPEDFLLKGFFIYTRDPVYDYLSFDFVIRYKAVLPIGLKVDYLIN